MPARRRSARSAPVSTLTAAQAATQTTSIQSPAAGSSPARTLYRLPVEPLEHAVALRGGVAELGARRDAGADQEHQRWVERTMRSFNRARRQRWVSVWAADELCVHLLGVHPAFIFGDMWWDTLAEIDTHREDARRRAA